MSLPRLVLVEDHHLMRQGLAALLSGRGEVKIVGEAANGLEALALVEKLEPQLVLMDLSMPTLNGLDATRQIKQRFPKIAVLVLSMYNDPMFVARALHAGASGYILKESMLEELTHDGGVDDYLSTILLMTMEHVRPLGVVVTPADCYIEPAVNATRKILDLMGRDEVPVAESQARAVNAFPRIWRRDSYRIGHFPLLNERDEIRTPLASEDGEHFIANVLRETNEPVTVLCTGPLTPLATALDIAPEIERNIKELVWMGGALNVNGNLADWHESGVDGSMESSVYWDPFAASRV